MPQRTSLLKLSKAQGESEGEGPVPMEITPEVDRYAVRAKKQTLFRDKKHIESSEAWDEDEEFKAEAVANLQQQIELLEALEQDLLPVEAKMR